MRDIIDQNAPQVLPDRASKNALSIEGILPLLEHNKYSWLKYTLNIIRLSKVLMLKQGKFLGPNVNMNYTKLHEIGNLQMKCKQSL